MVSRIHRASCRWVMLILLVTFTRPCFAANLLDPGKFSQTLTKLATDGLGTGSLQEEFDKLKFTESLVDGSQVIDTLAHSVSNKFKERFQVVQQLKQAVEKSWRNPPSSVPTECCNVKQSSGLEYDSRFRSNVDLTSICVKKSDSASSNPTYVADDVINEMKKISQNYPVIKWQYFASEQGILSNFPAFEDKASCGSYDPRFRPFYVETATPEPKDVVLVIDHSGSMSGVRLRVAKQAAKTVLRTMNPRDRIGLVKFNGEASTPVEYDGDGRGCHSQRLADATPVNIKYLENFVDAIVAEGGTHYSKALIRAFDLFKGTSVGGSFARKRVILFLTDGEPTDNKKTIIQTIKTKNAELYNSVVILTYGMLQNLPILREMAEQQGQGVTRAPDATVGKFTYVQNTNNLRGDMATYYDFFSTNTIRNEPIISIPYIDAFGTGLLTSITLPCYHGGNFIGVVGTDISMADLLSEVTYFQKGQSSYAWMADSSGRTMMHPLLPAPSNAFVDPIFMDITALEPEPGFDVVFQSIRAGGSGETSFKSKRYLARGGQIKEGVTVLELQSNYTWRPVDKTNFTVGIVVAEGDKEEMLSSLTIPSDFKFLYHRLDLVRPEKPCVHFSRYASKDATVVKFGAEAFLDPYKYLGLDETVSRVNAYKLFMTNPSASNPGFKSGIRDTVIASSIVENIWFREKADYTKYLSWRHFSSSNGVFRITPGVLINKSYDPTKRPWYHTAVRNTGLVALSTPYIDAFGTGVLITASQTIYRGEPTNKHTPKDQVMGVLGGDFPLSYFQKLLTDTYPKCEDSNYECFVLNGAGFFIMHKDFLSPDITAKNLEYVHITAKERDIAEDLLNKGHLKKKQCRNLEKINMENFYELEIPFQGVDTLVNGQRCRRYQISRIAESNAFLGIKKRDSYCQSRSCVFCNSACVRSVSDLTCQCPCISRLDFHYCRNEFPSSSVSICPVPAPVVTSEQANDPPVKSLQKCFDPQCDKKLNSDSCDGVVGCYWCVRDKYDAPLDKKYCADINYCYGGKEGTKAPGSGAIPSNTDDDDDKDGDKDGLSGGAIGGIVIGVTIPVIVVIFVVVKRQKRCAKERESRRNPPVVYPVPAPPPSFTAYNPPPQGYTAPYAPEPGMAMHATSIDMAPPSYNQSVTGAAQPSAPPYNPYYKGSFRHVK